MTLNEDGMRLLDNRPNEGGSYEQGQETRQSREAAAGDEGDKPQAPEAADEDRFGAEVQAVVDRRGSPSMVEVD